MTDLDPRLHAYRADLADKKLEDRLTAQHFVTGENYQITSPTVFLKSAPDEHAQILTQALCGEEVMVFEQKGGWAWAQLSRDGYVGYMPNTDLGHAALTPTVKVMVKHTHLYPEADIKSQPSGAYYLGSLLSGSIHNDMFFKTHDGAYIIRSHLAPIDMIETDFVAVADRFTGTPYLWGGKTSFGLDCSGLVQIALQAAGIEAPRDSDMQAQSLGRVLEEEDRAKLKRGDLVFWKGHVGIMCDPDMLLHANGHHMMVVREPFETAKKRIASEYGEITQVNRL